MLSFDFYLSRIPLSQACLKNAYLQHKVFSDALDGDKHLFRFEEESSSVLLQSYMSPDFGKCKQPIALSETKHVELSLGNGLYLNFCLRANLAKSVDGHKNKIPIFEEEEKIGWMENRAEKSGFEILPGTLCCKSMKPIWSRKPKDSKARPCNNVLFNGILQIKDIKLFKEAFINGIGSDKYIGMGLLSVMAAQ